METSKRGRLSEQFARLPAPRGERTTRHLLLAIVVSAGCAVMCGADTWVEIEEYGRAQDEWLKRVLPLPPGMPSHETLARVCARLKPEAFRTGVLAWLTEVQAPRGGPLASHLVALEGQAARHRVDRAIARGPLPMVSAWAPAAHLVWGQVAGAQQRNELTALPP